MKRRGFFRAILGICGAAKLPQIPAVKVQSIADYFKITKQCLDDLPRLQQAISTQGVMFLDINAQGHAVAREWGKVQMIVNEQGHYAIR